MRETRQLVSRAEELRALRLAQRYPERQAEFAYLIARVRRRVMRAVVTMRRVREYFGTRRHRVLGADLHVEGPERRVPLQARLAEVAIYDYERDVLVSVIMDLKRGGVVRIDEHPGHQPPPSAEEVGEAAGLALKDRSVARKASGRRLEATVSLAPEATIEGHPSRGRRVLTVMLWTPGRKARPVAGPIVVDLSQRKLVERMLPLYHAMQRRGARRD